MSRVVSVNVGRPSQVSVRAGRPIMSAIGKRPVSGRVKVAGVNLEGDDQADRRVHGGPDKAVYAYAHEDTLWWSARLARPLGPGMFGENLTVEGIDVSHAVIGEIWRVGTVELQVSQPRSPCFKLGLRFEDPGMVRQFAQAGRPGAYLRILKDGELGAGDEVDISTRPSHGITVVQVARAIFLDGTESDMVAAARAPELPESLREWILQRRGPTWLR